MRVVINRCWGGFSLSAEAILAPHAAKCRHIKEHEPRDYYGGDRNPDWATRFEQDKSSDVFRPIVVGGKILTSDHGDTDSARACPHLVGVVETLGAKANGAHAKLAIVDVPDGVSWEISDYDGMESVEETHRRWT